jgi:acyl-CoA synthetase (AMP-forming)/AMP-acid ligase II
MLPGTVVFMRGFNPAEIVTQVRKRRVSVLVSVPKILDVLAEHIRRAFPDVESPSPGREHVARRWWRYRAVHCAFGPKFWAVVVGAAPLEPALEEFWSHLGFLVIQGYGLTETAPIVAQPPAQAQGDRWARSSRRRSGSAHGEIWSAAIMTRGAFGQDAAEAEAFETVFDRRHRRGGRPAVRARA